MSEMMVLDKRDWQKAGKSAIVWFAPVALLYISAVLGVLQVEGHTFNIKDFIPSSYTTGGMIAWGLGRIQDILLRWSNETK